MSGGNNCRKNAIEHGPRVALVVILVLVTFGVYISIFGDRVGYDVDPTSWIPGFPDGDPNLGSVGANQRWLPMEEDGDDVHGGGGGGLTLQIVDNLSPDSDWAVYLKTYVEEWDMGYPDAVTLRLRTMEYDPSCRGVVRAMKVCNGDYGPTEWNGVNQVLLKDGYIVSSIARMNDYYLDGTNNETRAYTMCHELGHGLGLGHTDENFNNPDMGNCMDYTNNPENNMHPDVSNFITLERLYGNVNGSNSSAIGNVNGSSSGGVMQASELRYGGGRTRGRRMTYEEECALEEEYELYASSLSDDLPIRVFSDIVHRTRDSRDVPDDTDDVVVGDDAWALLDKTPTTEYHEKILGNGYSILDDDDDVAIVPLRLELEPECIAST
ncbi:hypothetical protein ACHAXA_011656 [Cyclostephanos tholiformis]|uniref:Uncharacterized protein n=1 Tax=Cyclostephanos tholiformis TaxID=382380 RepID=A0ABD3SEW0_9STRA